jgi:RHS repeat-associated protein
MPPAGQKAARLYDGLGRLTRLTEDYSGLDRYTDFAYDRAGRLTRQTGYTNGTTGAESTDYAYNKSGVKTKVTYPDDTGGNRGYVEFAVDAAMRLTKLTDQEGQDTVMDYDNAGRVLTQTKGGEIDTFAYDALGQITLAQRGVSGNLDSVSKVERLYNGLGRMTRERQTVKEEASARNVDYVYDKAGNAVTLTYPNGVEIETTFTAGNQRDTLSRGGSALADYDYVGHRVKRLVYETGANDVTFTATYDGIGRGSRLASARAGTDLAAFNYTFDAASNILTQVLDHRTNDPAENYTIDGLYRLTNAVYNQRTLTHGFVYDDLGNRLTFDENANQTTYGYNGVNELTKKDSAQVSYDKNGNLTKDAEGYTYHYDRQNKLTKIKKTSDSVDVAAYAYDALGRRIERIDSVADPDVTTRCYYDGDQVIEDTDASANVQRYYIWGNYIDELLMMWREEGQTDADYFVARNHLFSPVALVKKSDASITERYEYDAYGKVTFMASDYSALNPQQSSVDNRYLFTGRELDTLDNGSLKVMYYRARYYDPFYARFLQRDTGRDELTPSAATRSRKWEAIKPADRDPVSPNQIGTGVAGQYADGLNLYQYVRSRPTIFRDSTGLEVNPATDCNLYGNSSWTLGIIPDHYWMTGNGSELWDFGPDLPWMQRVYRHTNYSLCNDTLYPCQGQANFSNSAYAGIYGEVRNPLKLQQPVNLIYPTLKYGADKGNCCKKTNCGGIKSCLSALRTIWNNYNYSHLGRNCISFYSAAVSNCCLTE